MSKRIGFFCLMIVLAVFTVYAKGAQDAGAGTSGMGAVAAPMTITWAVSSYRPLAEHPKMVDYWNKMFNMNIVMNDLGSEYNTKLNLLFASNQIPDFFQADLGNLRSYYDQQVMAEIPMKTITDNMPAIYAQYVKSVPNVFDYGKVNGKIFFSSYSKVVEKESAARIKSLSAQLDQFIYTYVKQQLNSLTSNATLYRNLSLFFTDASMSSPEKIVNAVEELRSLVRFSNGILYSVDVYHPVTETSLSSLTGYMALGKEPLREDKNMWAQTIRNYNGQHQFGMRKISSFQNENLTLLGAFPSNATENIKAYLVLSINQRAFFSFLEDKGWEFDKYFLFSRDLTMVYGNLNELGEYVDTGLLRNMDENLAGTPVEDGNVYALPSLVKNVKLFYSVSQEAPVILLSVVTEKEFRSEMNRVLGFLGLAGILLLLFGFGVSGIFSRKLYTPLEKTVAFARDVPNIDEKERSAPLEPNNEYLYIEKTLENLSHKASEYEKTFRDYIKIMRYGFLQSLLNNQLVEPVEIRSKANFLNIMLELPCFCILRVVLYSSESSLTKRDMEAYNILSYIESLGVSGVINLYGINNSGITLSVLCNFHEKEQKKIREISESILSYCRERFSLAVRICISSVCKEAYSLSKLCRELDAVEPYLYFCLDVQYLSAQDIKALAADREFPALFHSKFEDALNAQDIAKVHEALKLFETEASSMEYNVDNCREFIQRIIHSFQKYLKKQNIKSAPEDINFGACRDIRDFSMALEVSCIRAFELSKNRIKNKRNLLASNLMARINSQLTDHLISLKALSYHFNISVSYAAKLVKEETGLPFSDYLNTKRLQIAFDRLNEETSLKIEDIAADCGFNSSAYFIKRFRQRYGMTPKAYRENKV